MFKPVTSKPSFPEIEERILHFWKENKIFEKSVSLRSSAPRFILYEGPPTANGSPGIHHALSRAFKDIMPRYKAMRGYYAPRKAGWDTHGLPVELEIEKMLGFSTKAQIEEYGVAQFNARCRESVFHYLKDWETMTERIGFWLDLEHPYRTLDNSYIESCWWAIRQLWNKRLIYQGYKVTPHCPRCGTSLSSHEVSLGYKDDTNDPSIYVKFKVDLTRSKSSAISSGLLSSEIPTYFLAWTTTPWTLPGNTALAVAPNMEYALVEYVAEIGGKQRLILAKTLLDKVVKGDCSLIVSLKGRELTGCVYEPLFSPIEYNVPVQQFQQGDIVPDRIVLTHIFYPGSPSDRQPIGKAPTRFPVICGDFVSMEEGTGIVHIAPAFGEIDFEVGGREKLYFIQPVDLEGKISGDYPFAGKFVKEADPLILNDLKSRELLYRSERIIHAYPFCWRCDAPLLYYAKKTWYIRTTVLKKELVAGNTEINWYPEHIKYGRFGDWLESNVDWAFSRERYWGTPLPIWQCQCGHLECIGSIDDLKRLAYHEAMAKEGHSLDECLKDLHRPLVDDIILKCPKSTPEASHYPDMMRRMSEVIDCWFDSGAMPFAQWHYPSENKDKFSESFPADFVCEAVDQTRGWFYSLHALSTLLFGRPCFKNVICLGHILDAQGEKMSKAKGNVVEPWQITNSYGADALRWYFFTSSPPGNVRRFSEEMVAEVVKNFLLTLWNTYSFFVIYANIDRFKPKLEMTTPLSDLDRWILSELNYLIEQVKEALDNYDPTTAARRIGDFVDNLSNWYVRRSRRRFWKSENDADKMVAYITLYQCLVILCKLLAPFTPFIAEELYQNLVCSIFFEAPQSVHLTDFPMADTSQINKLLMADTKLVMKISSLGRAARSKAGIKVRQPLAKAIVKARSEEEKETLSRLAYQIIDEINVKEVELSDKESPVDEPSHITVSDEEHWVAINTELSPELIAEGTARQVVRRLQTMRRAAGFDIADYIVTYYWGETEIKRVIERFADYIKQETLSRELVESSPEAGIYSDTFTIDGSEIAFGIRRL